MPGVLVDDLKSTLAGLCGGMLSVAGLDGSGTSGAWLYPLAQSATVLGIALANPLAPVDADLACVEQWQVPQLVEVAELRALENALENFQLASSKFQLQEADFGEIRTGLEAAIKRKAAYVKSRYGVGLGTISAGSIASGVSDAGWPHGDDRW